MGRVVFFVLDLLSHPRCLHVVSIMKGVFFHYAVLNPPEAAKFPSKQKARYVSAAFGMGKAYRQKHLVFIECRKNASYLLFPITPVWPKVGVRSVR